MVTTMKNRDDLNWQALCDLVRTVCKCRFKTCPIEILGRHADCGDPKERTTEECIACTDAWMNAEVKDA